MTETRLEGGKRGKKKEKMTGSEIAGYSRKVWGSKGHEADQQPKGDEKKEGECL